MGPLHSRPFAVTFLHYCGISDMPDVACSRPNNTMDGPDIPSEVTVKSLVSDVSCVG